MQSDRKETKSCYIENDQAFVQSFIALLGELRDSVPRKTSLDTIRQLLVSHGQKAHRMELVLAQLSNNILQHQLKTKRGPIKVISLMASVYQGELLPFFSGIVDLITRKLKENDEELHEVLSEAAGALIQFGLKDATEDIACENLHLALTKLFQLCGTGHRHTQKGASMCVVKAIQNISPFHLPMLLNEISTNLFKLIRSPNCKNHFYLLESILNVLIVYQGHPRRLEEYARLLLPAIFGNLDHKEGHVRKMAIEVMYTISHLLPEVAAPYKEELMKKLNQSRHDLVKAVRDISLHAIPIIQKLPHSDEAVRPSELLPEQKHQDDSTEIQDQSCEENKRSRSQGKSFELSPPRITTQPGQHQSAAKNKETPRPSSARLSPASARPKSTESRKQMKKNSNFFEAQKQKKEIDILVKSPTRLNNSSPSKIKKEPNLQIFSSPDKIYKYVYSDSNSPSRKKSKNGSSSPSSASPSKRSGNKFSPYSIKNVEEAEEVDEISNPEDKDSTINSNKIQKEGEDMYGDDLDEIRENGFKNLISQLITVNQKQIKSKKVISDFQATTHNEITQLVNKINDIESAVLSKSNKGSGNSSPNNVENVENIESGDEQIHNNDEEEVKIEESQEKAEEKVEEKEKEEKVEEKEEDVIQVKIENLLKENKINASYELCLNEGSDKHLLKLVETTDHCALKRLELSTLEKLLGKLKEIIEKGESEEVKEVLPCVIKVLQKYLELTSQVTFIYEKLVKKYGDKAKMDNVDVQQTKNMQESFEAIVNGATAENIAISQSPEDLDENKIASKSC